jgi:hypothetical protein
MAMLLLLCSTAVLAKQVTTNVSLFTDVEWRYLTKFAMDIGKGEWKIRARITKAVEALADEEVRLKATIYMDDNWPDVLNQDTCSSKVSEAKTAQDLDVPLNGDWSKEITGSLRQKSQPHVWYFAISDCDSNVMAKSRFKVEVSVTNTDGSEFSLEEKGLEYLYTCLLVFFAALLYSTCRRTLLRYRLTEEIDGPQLGLCIAVSAACVSLLLESLHLWVYSYNGRGVVVIDFLAQALEVVSHLTLTLIFILMSSGWTLKYRDFPESDIYFPIGLLVVMAHVLVVGIGRLTDDSYYKFSDYEGIAGVLLVVIRIGMWLWFLFFINDLLSSVTGRLALFTKYFGVSASAYFLAFPCLVVASWGFAPYSRHKVITVGTWVIEVITIGALTHLFSEKSSYYKLSTMSSSVLPGKIS